MLLVTDEYKCWQSLPLSMAEVFPHTWRWEPYLPLASLVLLDGDPGVGKTFVAMDLAARLSRGDAWPDGKPGVGAARASAFFPNRFDESLLRPRAEAAGGDLDQIRFVKDKNDSTPAVPNDRDGLAKMFSKDRITLAVVDPLPLMLAAAVGSHAPTAWLGLEPLQSAASHVGTVVLLVRHRTKHGRGPSLFRGLGGVSLAGAARSALLVARHPDDPDLRLLVHTKSNFGPLGPTLGFRIVNAAVRWEGPIDLSADELGSVPDAERVRRPRERAAEWLRGELANGPRKAAELIQSAAERGIPLMTLRRARALTNIRVTKRALHGQQSWYWHDPAAEATAEPEDGLLAEISERPSKDSSHVNPRYAQVGRPVPQEVCGTGLPTCANNDHDSRETSRLGHLQVLSGGPLAPRADARSRSERATRAGHQKATENALTALTPNGERPASTISAEDVSDEDVPAVGRKNEEGVHIDEHKK
jgi:hypothetical protein